MSWQLLPARDAFPAFAAEWDRLNAELYDSHPMFDSRFFGPLLKHFGKGSELLCIHRAHEGLDGALILRPHGLGRWELFLPAQAQAGPVLLRDARLIETLFEILPGFAWSIDLLAIDPDYAPDWARLRVPHTIKMHAMTMSVGIHGSFDEYWQTRPRQLKKNLRRYRLRTEQTYGVPRVTCNTDAIQIETAMVRYGGLEMSGWKGKAGTAVSHDNIQGKFYLEILRNFSLSGQAKIIELQVGDQIVASRLIISNEHMWIILKTAYDETFAGQAPGRQLLQETLRHAFSEAPGVAIEFYTKANRDQAEWATAFRQISHHQIYRNKGFIALRGALWATLIDPINRLQRISGRAPVEFNPLSINKYVSADQIPFETATLFDDVARANVEFSLDWFNNLQKEVFTGDPGVRYYISELNGAPAAALPIRLARANGIRRIESLGNYYTSLYSPLISTKGAATDLIPLLKVALRDAGTTHAMRFSPMDPDSPAYEGLLAALWSIGWVPFRYFCFGNWFLKVTDSWSAYLSRRDGKHRSTIKRMKKKFDAEGGRLEIVTSPTAVDMAIKAFNDVYALSWKKPEPYPGFVPGLIRWLADRGQLRLGIAWLNEQPVAAQLWTVSHGRAHIFKVAYDERYSSYSPGTLVTAHLMEHVIDQDGVEEVDFLIGDDKYKQTWMSHRRERWGIVAYNPRTLGGLMLLIREIAGRAFRHLWQKKEPHEKAP